MLKRIRIAKILGIVFFVLITLNTCKVKNNSVDYIKLEIDQSRRFVNNKVSIEITKEKFNYLIHIKSLPMFRKQEWEKTRIDTTFFIENKDLKQLSEEVVKLIKCDFSKSEVVGLDGASYSIKFRFEGKEKEYNIWSPNCDTEKRGLTHYLKVCELIVETVGLKTKEIL